MGGHAPCRDVQLTHIGRLGLNPDTLEDLEAELEVEIARSELTLMKKESESQIETYKRRFVDQNNIRAVCGCAVLLLMTCKF